MRVEDIMERNVVTVRWDATLREAALRMLRDDIGALPVLDAHGSVIGILTDRDIVLRAVTQDMRASETTVSSVLTSGVHSIAPDTDVIIAARIMAAQKVRRLPVLDGERLAGMLSMSDFTMTACDAHTPQANTAAYILHRITVPGKPHMD